MSETVLGKLLAKETVQDVFLKSKVEIITFTTRDNVVEAFKKVFELGKVCAPVLDVETNKFIGFFDIRDLTQFVVSAKYNKSPRARTESKEKHLSTPNSSSESGPKTPNTPKHMRSSSNYLRHLFDTASENHPDIDTWEHLTIRDCIANFDHNKFAEVEPTDSCLKVALLLKDHDVHHVAVKNPDKDGSFVCVINQARFLRHIETLQLHSEELKQAFSVTVEASKIGTSPVKSVKDNESALYAFQYMAQHNRPSMAIVHHENGRLLGNISASDLQLFMANPRKNVPALQLHVLQFLSLIRQASVSEDREFPSIAVKGTDAIGKAVAVMAATRIHRIFVADDAHGFKPEAVITLTDILDNFL